MEINRFPFIVIEGCDQTGKSTLQQFLTSAIYHSHDILMERISFPDSTTSIGQLLQLYLGKKIDLDDYVAHHLFSANRWESFEFILNTLPNTPILCDRYVASGRAYTIAQGNISLDWCRQLDVGLPKPDLTIYLENSSFRLPQDPNYEESRFDIPLVQQEIKATFERNRGIDDEKWVSIQTDELTPRMVMDQAKPHVDNLLGLFKDQNFPIYRYSLP